jgi:hypothetical protein
MMRHRDYNLMLSQGRKAGLTSRELNSALSMQPVEGGEQPGQPDCNGYISEIDASGHRTLRQADQPRGG